MNLRKIVVGILAALTLSWVPAAYAANNTNSTEFGVVGDLSVYGNSGYLVPNDPDVKIQGFTVFGATQTTYTGMASPMPGSVMINASLAVSSGAYFVGGSTFAAGGAYFTGVSSFTAGAGSIYVKDGVDGQVMIKDGSTGALKWGSVASMVSGDNMGNHIATTTLQMSNFGIVNVASITANGYITTYSSMTIGGNAGVGGGLIVAGDENLTGKLNVQGTSTFVSSVTAQGNSQIGSAYTNVHGINMAPAADTGLSIAGQSVAGDYAAKFYSGATLAAWIKKK
jgi:hypothetical protein